MFRRAYKVKGEDVNDFMVMQNFAYHSYVSCLLKTFLFEKGYSKHKLDRLRIGFDKSREELIHRKHLMFTQVFFVDLEFFSSTSNTQKISVKNRFFNAKNELCVTAITELYWMDYNCGEISTPPQNISKHFLPQYPLSLEQSKVVF